MHFDTSAKHRAPKGEEYTAELFILILEFENRFQDCKKKSSIYVCNIILS